MKITPYAEVDALLSELLADIQAVLGEKLVGLYLHGSLVYGDFDANASDIDLLAALAAEVSDAEFDGLAQMHRDFAVRHKAWDDRVEVCYIATAALQTVRSRASRIVNISPGEPIHRLESDRTWLMKWYFPRERGVALYGPPPQSLIEPISKEEYVECVKDHVRHWGSWLQDFPHTHYPMAYAILTLCRAAYAVRMGEQVSKKKAAEWAQLEFPGWSELIGQALQWKIAGRDSEVDEDGFQKTVQLVNAIRKLILEP